MPKKQDVRQAHEFSIGNRERILKSDQCGCFHCLAVFEPSEIDVWWPDGEKVTAVCPMCGVDSVIGSASGYEITPGFLKEMESYWFRAAKNDEPGGL